MRSLPNISSYVCLAALVLTPSVAFAQDGSGGLITEQWVGPSESGSIGVQIIAPPGVPTPPADAPISVKMAGMDGTIYTAEVTAESDGGLSLEDVPPGIYTMVARGPGMVACYAVHILPARVGDISDAHQTLEIAPAAVPPAGVRSAIIRYTPPTVDVPVEMDYTIGEMLVDGQAPPAQMHRVLQTDGGIRGQIFRAGSEMIGSPMTNVMIFSGGEPVAQTITARDGLFMIETLPTGAYSLIAVGPTGIGITGLKVVNEVLPIGDTVRNETRAEARLVAAQAAAFQPQFQLQLAPAGLESPLIQELIQVDPSQDALAGSDPEAALSPAMGGGPMGSGGGFGGGGGGLGGGGMGGLLGLAGAGIGIAAFASDDDDTIDTPPVVSPVNPATNSVPPVISQGFNPNLGN